MTARKVVRRNPAQVFKLWVKALRSGKYKQTTCALKNPTSSPGPSFCCLGVLCDLDIKDGGGGYWVGNTYYGAEGSTKTATPPEEFRHYLGLDDTWESLTGVNDSGMSFRKIANHIEALVAPRALARLTACKLP